MHEKQEIIARALEIAIVLTKADHTWLKTDDYNNLIISDPLFITMKRVIRIMNDESRMIMTKIKSIPGVIRHMIRNGSDK